MRISLISAALVAALVGFGSTVALVLATVGTAALLVALRFWPAQEPELLGHAHPELPAAHPHLAEHGHGDSHRHRLVIDALHPRWPRAAG